MPSSSAACTARWWPLHSVRSLEHYAQLLVAVSPLADARALVPVGGLTTAAVYSPFVVPAATTVIVGRKLAAAAPAAAPANCKTAAQVVAETPELSTLGSLVAKLSPKLQAELTNKGGAESTLFAPNNAAIESLLKQLKSPEMLTNNATALTALISYHLVPGAALTASQLSSGQQLKSALGGSVPPLKIVKSADGVLVQAVGSEAAVVRPDLRTCRGIIHVIDTVLIPVKL